MELTESFWNGLYVFLGGWILAVITVMYKSKCDQMNLCCGLIVVHRNVDVEMANDLRQMEAPREVD